MIYLQLIYEFFQIGLFSVGGGMATLPFLMDLTSKYDWFTKTELTNMIAISESTPGPIGINMATYAGYNAAGIPGAIAATFALTAPALIIIVIIAKFLANFSENQSVQSAFYGIRPTVAALITYAVWELMKTSLAAVNGAGVTVIDYTGAIICLTGIGIMQLKPCRKLHPLVWIVLGAAVGILFQL